MTYFPALKDSGASQCKSCLTATEKYSKHNVTFCTRHDIDKYNFDEFDIIHTHNAVHDGFFTTKAKVIYDAHNFVISCPMGGNVCLILNRFLKEPLTCSNCLGYFGIKTGGDNMKMHIKLAQKADLLAVHSEFMKEYYHNYSPVVFPLPLETDVLIPCTEKEEYIFYTGRLSFEKNPQGFIDVVERSGMKGKMVLYTLSLDIIGTERHYDDMIKSIKENKNIELILNPTIPEMIDLVKHARFTVLPYFFAEPFGIAAANSILCGTPLVVFPYGNLRNMTHLLPKTLDDMVKIIKMDDKQYLYNLEKTLKKGEELRMIHKPENAIKVWDEIYDKLDKYE